MGPTEYLIEDYAREKHPLGLPIRYEEVPGLIKSLQHRLNMSDIELDQSPVSLKRLERRLADYYNELADHNLEDDDLVRLVREVTAYIGNVLVLHANGRWDQSAPNLYSTGVRIDGPWEIIKDQYRVSPHPTLFILGGEAAWNWDRIVDGKKVGLYRMFQQAISKRLKENLI